MVSSNRRRLKKPCDLRALFSFFKWIKIVCCGCLRTRIPSKEKCMMEGRMRRSGRGKDSSLAKQGLAKGNVILEPVIEQQSELFVWEFPSHGGEEGDMFKGRFYVGSKVQTELEMRSPVEESKRVTMIVKAPKNPTKIPESSQVCSNHLPAATDSSAMAQSGSKIDIVGSSPSSKEAKNQSSSEEFSSKMINIAGSSPSSKEFSSTPIDIAGSSPSNKEFKNLRSKTIDIAGSSPSSKEFKYPSSEPIDISPSSKESKSLRTNYNPQEHPSSMIADKNAEILPRKGSKPRRSLTDNDFAELRGCIDLGFVFTPDDIPDLRETLPALEVCYAISQNLHDPQASMSPCDDSGSLSPESPSASPTISSWKIASPGDQPQQVKTRLRHWAQAVACTIRQSC